MLRYITRSRGATVMVLAVLALLSFALARPSTNAVLAAPVSVLNETFDNTTGFTVEDNDSFEPFFSDDLNDYLGLTDGAGTFDYGSAVTAPNGEKAYTGFTGQYLNGQDIDGEGAAVPFIFTWSGLSITSLTSLEFSGDFAEFFDSPGDIDGDPANTDYIEVRYRIDGGAWQNLIWFYGADFSSGNFNGIFREDTDFNGIGDGIALGNAAQTFTKTIAGTGNTLDLQMRVSVEAGDEDFAVDNFIITGDDGSVATPPPQVTTTVPADTAIGVALNSSITVNFDQLVDYTSGAVTVDCPSYGAPESSTSIASGVNFIVFDPTDFGNGETCTVTVAAANVVDSSAGNNLDGNGDGTGGDDYVFTFTTIAASVNTNLVINELDADQAGTDAAEFVELYDGGVGNTDLTGLVLVLYNGSDDASYLAFDLDGQTTDANGFFVLCGDAGNVANCDLDVTPNTNLIQNGADAAALYQGDATDFPVDTPVTTVNLVDALVYDTDDGDDAGLLVLLNAAQPQINERNDSGAGSDGASHSNQRCPDGDPATDQRNTADFEQWPPNPGETNLCAVPDFPPQVTTTVPADTAIGVATNATITIDFDEIVDLTATAIMVDCPVPTPVPFTAVPVLPANDTTTITLTPDNPLPTNTTCTVTVIAAQTTDNDDTADQLDGNGDGTGGDDYVFTFTTVNPATACTAADTPIYDVQGNGTVSPLVGNPVTVQGVVTALSPDYNPSGFTIQEITGDADPATSDGIYIESGAAVAVGNVVQVTGTVAETFGITLVDATAGTVEDCAATGTITPTVVTLPLVDYFDWEQYEGMLVDVQAATGALTLNDVYNVGRFGEYELASGGRIPNFTQANPPDVVGYGNYQDQIEDRTILIDDANSAQNPDPAITVNGSEMSATNTLRAGYTVSNVVGVVNFGFGEYRIFPTQTVNFITSANPRTTAPDGVGASTLRVASFNVLNYFNGDGVGGGFPTPRGADTSVEFIRQRDKIIEAIINLDADIIGLVELENDGFAANSAIQDLVNGLNAAGTRTYGFADPGTAQVGDDAIAVGIIYDVNVVNIVAGTTVEILDDSDAVAVGFTPPLFNGASSNRASLAATFEVVDVANPSLGEQLVVVVNHFKSKGGTGTGADADAGDGQGNWNARRTAASDAVLDWLALNPTGSGEVDAILLGDLNAYAQEDPITALENAGYTDLGALFGGTYSYGFPNDRNTDPEVQTWGTLDYAMASASLLPQVTGATEWHINADEPLYMDYNTEFQTANHVNTMYNADAYRSSDHDPIIVGLDLGTTIPIVTSVIEVGGTPLDGAVITTEVGQIDIAFNIIVAAGTGVDGADNPDNYILLAEGATPGFQTVDCAGGVDAGDTRITQTGTVYDPIANATTLTFSPALTTGNYRLHICGTTSIVSDPGGVPLNGGADEIVDFTINVTTTAPVDPGTPGTDVPQPEDLGVTELPSTGETPDSRNIIIAVLVAGVLLTLGAGFWVMRNRVTT